MRLVIADDEDLLRYHLRALVAEADRTVAVREAVNGRDLVDLVLRGEADAAIVDVRMPKLDGLAAIRELRRLGAEIPWAVLSSYAEFDYAREALDSGALGYALKPPSPEEVRRLVTRLSVAAERARNVRLRALENRWTAVDPVADRLGTVAPEQKDLYQAAVFAVDGEDAVGALEPLLRERLRLGEHADLLAVLRAGADRGQATGVAVCPARPGREADSTALKRFWNQVYAALRGGTAPGPRVCCLYGGAVAGLDAAHRNAARLEDLLALRSLLPTAFLAQDQAEDLLRRWTPQDLAGARRSAGLAVAWQGGSTPAFRDQVTDALAALGLVGEQARIILIRYLEQTLGTTLPAPEAEGDSWVGTLAEKLSGLAPPAPAESGDVVDRVQAYVRRHFCEHLSLGDTARTFALTPNYLSALFHRRVGRTFVDYVTDLRLDRARDLLRAGRSVKESAWAVGYAGQRHFSRLYRLRFGHNPGQEKDAKS